jgi:hypothetical protein
MANHRFALYRSYATINLPASSACNRSAENCTDDGTLEYWFE